MGTNKKRALNVALVITGLAIAALGTVLFLAVPRDQDFMGRGYGAMRFGTHGMRAMGLIGYGGLALLGLAAVGGTLAFGHALRRNGRSVNPMHCFPSGEEDSISLLRREFAEGRIGEDDYRKRLDALLSLGREP